MNCSAASVLQVGSSLVDPYSAIAAGCAALYGPIHGGAAEASLRMLLDIGSPDNVLEYIEKVKKKEKVLSGFGHRIYRTSDPRSFIIRKTAEEVRLPRYKRYCALTDCFWKVFAITGTNPLLATARRLHDEALKDEYFVKRRLYPNVDFWSGVSTVSLASRLKLNEISGRLDIPVSWLCGLRSLQYFLRGTNALDNIASRLLSCLMQVLIRFFCRNASDDLLQSLLDGLWDGSVIGVKCVLIQQASRSGVHDKYI